MPLYLKKSVSTPTTELALFSLKSIRSVAKIRQKLSLLISMLVINPVLTWPWSTLTKGSLTSMYLLTLSLMRVCLALSVMEAKCGIRITSFKTPNAAFPIDLMLESSKQ